MGVESEKAERVPLLKYSEIPAWQKCNDYILSGYRPISGSLRTSLRSAVHVHNETINIHSHLVGAAVFAILPLVFWECVVKPNAHAVSADMAVVSVYVEGVAVCFVLSAVYHIFDNHSERYSSFLVHLDYLGIIVLMWGASIPTIYYGFICNSRLQYIYWGMMSSIALLCAIATLHPTFGSPRFRVYRALMYSCLGLTGLVFIVHGLVLYGWETQRRRMALDWMACMAAANLLGAAAFASRVPERWAPYRFDIIGASHQIFHVAVVIAAVLHFLGLIRAFHNVRTGLELC